VSALGDGLRLAVGTLTLLPVPPPRAVGPRVAAVAMLLAPVAVLPVAGAAGLTLWALHAGDAPPLLGATLALAVLALGSGALHLDGLADTADGLAVPGDRARRLEVMRRGDVGPVGAVTLLFVILVQVSALAGAAAETLLMGVVVSRSTLALACVRGMPAARSDGLGRGVAGTVPRTLALLVITAVALAAVLVEGWRGLAGVGTSLVVTGVVVVVAVRRLGGVTGDVLGACVELALAGYLVSQVLMTS
jgi:adenosylcobinamide-GDP ribazoletransferase